MSLPFLAIAVVLIYFSLPSPLILPPVMRTSKLSCGHVRRMGVLGLGAVVGGGGVVGGGFSLQRTPAASVDSQSCTPHGSLRQSATRPSVP